MSSWLLLDCDYLCHRAYHALPNLSFNDIPTAVPFGFFRDVINLADTFATGRLVFLFDGAASLRKQAYPEYKANRLRGKSPEEQGVYYAVRAYINVLRTQQLAKLGFANVFCHEGYEADDLIASLVQTAQPSGDMVIVSADKDLYQLLRKGVCIYRPHKQQTITHRTFQEEWRLPPSQWALVKAIAGCSTDDVDGVPGVAEKTAAKYLRQELGTTSKAFASIQEHWALVERNLPLVTLPYEDTPTLQLWEDAFDKRAWKNLCDELGMKTLRHWCPIGG